MKLKHAGVLLAGMAALIMAGLEVLKYGNQKSRHIPRERPAGTYEVDMDEYF